MARAFTTFATLAAASAALVAAPAVAQEAFNGPYVGVQAGWQRDNSRMSVDTGALEITARAKKSGFEYGAQLGYDAKMGEQFVLGAEAFLSGSTGKNRLPGDDYLKAGRSFGLLARAGVLATPQTLVYATGGWENARFSYHNPGGKASTNKDGWTLGVGVEQMIDTNVGLRVEYRYSRFGNSRFDAADALVGGGGDGEIMTAAEARLRNTRNRVLAGVNFRF